ncbi:MAG: dienelactone hydrolase family protein [Nannocystis sp.]|nr:dienelactone hydrolase family protein [Nannocystis sp.]MBA3549682.1 dienelactone hydrolase family protein [Nannocystis sp.]
MDLANVMAKTMMCAAVLVVGCVDESDALEAANQADMALIDDAADVADVADVADDAALDLVDDEREHENEEQVLDLAAGELGPGTAAAEIETLDVIIPPALHSQGIELPAKLVRPKLSSASGKRPAMLVLHGSGGLLKDGSGKGKQPCSSEMESQYQEWADRLAGLGYTVLLPSSYSARGFCDKHKDDMPKHFDDKPEQIISRIYDTDAASRYLCELKEVDCERMGVLGFSQGGTMVMLALHWQVEHAISYFRKTKAKDFDIEIPDLKPGRPEFKMGIAYYPGCGFDGAVPTSTSKSSAIENKYSPTGPLTILHGSKDSLLKQCSTEHATGARQIQSKQVAEKLGIEDLYEITVYKGASHSFDSSGSKNPADANKGADGAARVAALKVTLHKLATQL